MEEYRVSLSQFEGPLDLLLHLIEKAELNIEDIFVSEITSQYLAMIGDLSDVDMDKASAFLSVAAQLLFIKSRSLLPRPAINAGDSEEDPEQQLIRQLREYKAFKEVSESLSEKLEEAKKEFARLPEDIILPPQKVDLENATIDNLYQAFLLILNREEEEKKPETVRRVRPDAYTVRDRVNHLRKRLASGRVAFWDLFTDTSSRIEKIVTFMALLEMLAHGEVRVTQGATFAPIYIRPKKLNSDDTDYTYMDEDEE